MSARWFWHVASPMLVGVAIYFLFRPGPAIVVHARSLCGLDDPLSSAALPALVYDQLPDAAWAYALVAMVRLMWRGGPRGARVGWTIAAVALAIGWEAAQRVDLVPGTFSWADLVTSALACALAAWRVRGEGSGEPGREGSGEPSREIATTHPTPVTPVSLPSSDPVS